MCVLPCACECVYVCVHERCVCAGMLCVCVCVCVCVCEYAQGWGLCTGPLPGKQLNGEARISRLR